MRPAFTHVALHVKDLDASVNFYAEYAKLQPVHERRDGSARVVWLAMPQHQRQMVFVLIAGGHRPPQAATDYSHLGFAVESRAQVDEIATRARQAAILIWEPSDNSFPVGYYCGVRDPDGHAVEFSYGQPLGPGAEPDFPSA